MHRRYRLQADNRLAHHGWTGYDDSRSIQGAVYRLYVRTCEGIRWTVRGRRRLPGQRGFIQCCGMCYSNGSCEYLYSKVADVAAHHTFDKNRLLVCYHEDYKTSAIDNVNCIVRVSKAIHLHVS